MIDQLTGALYFSSEPPHITGYLKIGNEHFEITGHRVNKIRSQIKARQIEKQEDMFDEDTSGDGET